MVFVTENQKIIPLRGRLDKLKSIVKYILIYLNREQYNMCLRIEKFSLNKLIFSCGTVLDLVKKTTEESSDKHYFAQVLPHTFVSVTSEKSKQESLILEERFLKTIFFEENYVTVMK
jgi:hypothetical protein